MKPRVNIKVEQISEGCYRAFSDEMNGLSAEGSNIWEALNAARNMLRLMFGPETEGGN